MYTPPAFDETRPEVLSALIAAHPLALLVTTGDDTGPTANLIPMTAEDGVLRAHLARANPQLAELRAAQAAGRPVLAVFQGPQAYVSPGWYASKAEHGRVVPTWNFLMVQVRGVPQVIDEPDWLAAQVTDLTDRLEAGGQVEGQPEPQRRGPRGGGARPRPRRPRDGRPHPPDTLNPIKPAAPAESPRCQTG